MDDVLPRFLAECWRNLTGIDAEILGLEELDDSSRITHLVRTIHTIKLNSGFIGLTELGLVAHAVEGVLAQLQGGRLPVSPQSISLVLEGVDAIKGLLHHVESDDDHRPPGNRELIGRLNAFAAGKNVVTVRQERRPIGRRVPTPEKLAASVSSEKTALLIFDGSGTSRMAIPLSFVARLERFPRHAIERTSSGFVVQYRSGLVFLLPIEGAEPVQLIDPQQAIVLADESSSTGLLIERVDDIVQERLVIHVRSRRPGFSGTAIIKGRATDIVDARHYLTRQSANQVDVNVGTNA